MKRFGLSFCIATIIALLAVTTSCSQDSAGTINTTTNGQTQITVGLPTTRTSLGEKSGESYPTYWSANDIIVVDGIASTSSTISEDRTYATFYFAGQEIAKPSNITYPYTEGSLCSKERPTVVFNSEQHYTAGTFGVGDAPMCGYYSDSDKTILRHLAGVMRLAIKGTDTLSKIEIIAEEGVALAGEFDVDCQTGTISAIEGRTTNRITYFVEESISATQEKHLYIAIPAGDFGKCEVVVTTKNETTMKLHWSATDVKAGVVREFKPFTFKSGASIELEGMQSENGDLVIDTPDGPVVVEKYIDPDSVVLMSAKREKLDISNAEGFVISTEIFDSAQNISVVKISPEKHKIKAVLPAEETKVSEMGASLGADYGINGCYWHTITGEPTSLIKIDGELLWNRTSTGLIPRVNGLLFIYEDHIEIMESYEHPYFTTAIEGKDNVLSCGPMLMDEGVVIPYDEFLSQTNAADNIMSMITFFQTRHPRTIIGKDKKNTIYFIVVDGRSSGNAEGMSIQELQKICAWFEMTDAMNLDGGGSSTLWSRELGVINYPCDNKKFDHEGERKVLTSIFAIEK